MEKKGQEKVKEYNEPKINREKFQFLSSNDRQTGTSTLTISLKKSNGHKFSVIEIITFISQSYFLFLVLILVGLFEPSQYFKILKMFVFFWTVTERNL